MTGAQAAWLADGRLHLHHGPIDLIVDAEGSGRAAALAAAQARFSGVLEDLVPELAALRRPGPHALRGEIARAMAAAVAPHADVFVTPMAAVAGAVADTVLAAMVAAGPLDRAYVNNGGDIAFHLTGSQRFTAAVASDPPARVHLTADGPVRGLATSGRGGRSHSLGIADSVTVLARTAAAADVAATLIANAVDLPGHPAVTRAPAAALAPDSDLGDRLVTVDLGPLTPAEVGAALDAGLACAQAMQARGLIVAGCLCLRGQMRTLGDPAVAMEAVETSDA